MKKLYIFLLLLTSLLAGSGVPVGGSTFYPADSVLVEKGKSEEAPGKKPIEQRDVNWNS
jgi:hypothetical protein